MLKKPVSWGLSEEYTGLRSWCRGVRCKALLRRRCSPIVEEKQRDKHRVPFLLTGSSARRLRRGGVNLLGGRARTKYLHPLTYAELGARFNLERVVQRGLLPSIYFSDDPHADLEAYAGT